jgi:hypothetical protein
MSAKWIFPIGFLAQQSLDKKYKLSDQGLVNTRSTSTKYNDFTLVATKDDFEELFATVFKG